MITTMPDVTATMATEPDLGYEKMIIRLAIVMHRAFINEAYQDKAGERFVWEAGFARKLGGTQDLSLFESPPTSIIGVVS